MANKKKQASMTVNELRRQLKSLQYDRDSIMDQASPNKTLLSSIDRKMDHLTKQLIEQEHRERVRENKQRQHRLERKDTLERQREREQKEELKTSSWEPPKMKFNKTISLKK